MIDFKILFEQYYKPEQRNKIILISGIAVLVLYALIWLPIRSTVDDLRDTVMSQQNEIEYLQQAKANIVALRSQLPSQNANNDLALLNVVDNTIRDQQIDGVISELQEVDNDEVRLSFSRIAFDDLNTWLENLSKNQGIHVTRLTVSALEATGMVQASLILHRG